MLTDEVYMSFTTQKQKKTLITKWLKKEISLMKNATGCYTLTISNPAASQSTLNHIPVSVSLADMHNKNNYKSLNLSQTFSLRNCELVNNFTNNPELVVSLEVLPKNATFLILTLKSTSYFSKPTKLVFCFSHLERANSYEETLNHPCCEGFLSRSNSKKQQQTSLTIIEQHHNNAPVTAAAAASFPPYTSKAVASANNDKLLHLLRSHCRPNESLRRNSQLPLSSSERSSSFKESTSFAVTVQSTELAQRLHLQPATVYHIVVVRMPWGVRLLHSVSGQFTVDMLASSINGYAFHEDWLYLDLGPVTSSSTLRANISSAELILRFSHSKHVPKFQSIFFSLMQEMEAYLRQDQNGRDIIHRPAPIVTSSDLNQRLGLNTNQLDVEENLYAEVKKDPEARCSFIVCDVPSVPVSPGLLPRQEYEEEDAYDLPIGENEGEGMNPQQTPPPTPIR